MFRIPVKISTTEVIKLNARLTSSVSRQLATSTSNASSPPPPPPPHSAGDPPRRSGAFSKLLLATLGATAITGATLAYAKSNQEFRNILKEYVPWTDDAIALLYMEKEVPGAWVISSVKDMASSASDLVFGSDTKKPSVTKPDILAPIASPRVQEIVNVKDEIHTKEQSNVESEAVKDEVGEVKLVSSIDFTKGMDVAPVNETEDFAVTLRKYVSEAESAYRNAIVVLKDYSDRVNTVMENCDEMSTGKGPWDELRKASKRKLEAECRLKKALKLLDTCSGIKAEQARAELSGLRREYEKLKVDAEIASKYWPQVEEARRHFVDEIEGLFPRADIEAGTLDTRGGDTDALLLVSLRKVLLYQQQLAKLECELTYRVDQALKGTDQDVVKAKVEIELARERRELALIFQKKMALAKAEADKQLADQLKRQLELHNSHLQDALDHRSEQIAQEERRKADERSAAEKAAQGVRLAAVLGRLQGVDQALKARSDADKMARQAQMLWAACEALEGVLRGRTSKQMRVSVAQELDAIASAAADTDELVASVLRGVPAAAREKGVLSEVALRDRFLRLEKVCRSLAMVPECGARLHVFVLSWLQGMLMARPPPPPKGEMLDEPTDFSKLDTYEILDRAKLCVDRGNWGQALRYIHLLKGAAATVARDWAYEMALHLEARQAASALLAHAAASGLLYL